RSASATLATPETHNPLEVPIMNVPIKSETLAAAEDAVPIDRKKLGQIVLVLQGGGALGAYQAGVYQALQEVGIEPDWVIGTSIGAINASLIAGNPPE